MKPRFVPAALAAALLGLGCGASSGAPAPDAPKAAIPDATWAEGWKAKFGDAERELHAWVEREPVAAGKLFAFDQEHPRRAHSFVEWAVQRPNEALVDFTSARSGWSTFVSLTEDHRVAMDAFVRWCRRHADAATELSRPLNGLSSAAQKLYPGMYAQAPASH